MIPIHLRRRLIAEPHVALRNAGLKVTSQRQHVLETVRASPQRHVTVEDVFRGLGRGGIYLSLPTVYRALTQLERAGLLIGNVFGGKAVYEINEGDRHGHLICLGCGQIMEFISVAIEKQHRKLAATHGYHLVERGMVLHGHCEACSAHPVRRKAAPDADGNRLNEQQHPVQSLIDK